MFESISRINRKSLSRNITHRQSYSLVQIISENHRLLLSYLQVDYASAETHLRQSLIAIGRPLPTSRFDQMCAFVWNVFRFALGLTGIGPWIARRKSELSVRNSARDAAQVYHILDQLHMTGKLLHVE